MIPNPQVGARGELDAATSPDLQTDLFAAIDGHPGATVVVDLSEVEFLDSTALKVLLGALKRARATGGDVALQGVPTRVWKVFTITKLDEVFDVID